MNIENIIWNNKSYKDFINYLFKLRDEKYALFHFKLLKNDKISLIGIRMPTLKKMAKNIAKTNYIDYINVNNHKYYEEVILHGLVVTNLKLDFDKSIKLFDEYIKYIDSWASCDLIVSNYKLFKTNLEKGFIKINEYLKNDDPWINRVGLVLLLNYYINDTYVDKVLDICMNYNNDNYYVKMANAWLISICLIKYYEKTKKLLLNSNLDDWTYNKSIQKAIESYRIINKDDLRKMKR